MVNTMFLVLLDSISPLTSGIFLLLSGLAITAIVLLVLLFIRRKKKHNH